MRWSGTNAALWKRFAIIDFRGRVGGRFDSESAPVRNEMGDMHGDVRVVVVSAILRRRAVRSFFFFFCMHSLSIRSKLYPPRDIP